MTSSSLPQAEKKSNFYWGKQNLGSPVIYNNYIKDTDKTIKTDYQQSNKVGHYIYLDQHISLHDSPQKMHIKRRITLGGQIFGRVSSIFKNKKELITLRVKFMTTVSSHLSQMGPKLET